MMKEFEMSDLGLLCYFLGIEFKTIENGTMMHQTKYVTDLLKKFNMFKCNSIVTLAKIGLVLEKKDIEELINLTYFK